MKKVIYLFFSMVLFAFYGNAQSNSEFTIFDLTNEDKDTYVWGGSFDGIYSTGYINGGINSFVWTKQNGIDQFDTQAGGSQAYAVSNNGIVVGQFIDSAYMYRNWLNELVPLQSAGYFKDGKWNSLGIKYENNFGENSGSEAYAISADGTVVGGGWKTTNDLESTRTAPVIWTISGETITSQELEFVNAGNGAKILAISGDGSVAGGWADYTNVRIPAVWVNGQVTYIEKNGLRLEGEVLGISENGQYAALIVDGDAAIYDIEADELTIIPANENSFRSYATSVSNNGIAVGYEQIGFFQADREAFIYGDKFGKFLVKDYIEELNLNFDIPATFNFAFPARISSDGMLVSGYGTMNTGTVVYDYAVGWAIKFEEHLEGFNPAKNLTGYESSYGNINLTWEIAADDMAHTLEGYNVYRNGVKVNTSVVTSATYDDTGLSNGNYLYVVKAVWDGGESLSSNEIKINTGKLPMPFFDDFSDNGFDGKYWNKSTLDSESWIVNDNGINPPGADFANPIGNVYEESITSAHIEANNAQELYLSYNLANAVKMFDWETNQDLQYEDSLKVEIYNGTNWNTIHIYGPYNSNGGTREQRFEYKTHNISQYSGDIIRVRFTAFGDNPGNGLQWNLDNINIYTPETELQMEAPLKVGNYIDINNNVRVIWADPHETVNLSYMEALDAIGAVGNEGTPFIAAILFTPNDLQDFNNYIMKEITVNLYRVADDLISDTAQYKLVAFQDGERVLDQNINSYVAREWNTFTLNTPLTIDASKSLYFGVEVTSHDNADWPVGTAPGRQEDNGERMVNVYDGWANLISEDNGATWRTLTSYNADLAESFAIRATIYKDENTTPKERLLGYRVYRNGEDILAETYGEAGVLSIINNFLDNDPITDGTACYEVSAYYDIQDESEKSEQTCVEEAARIVIYFPYANSSITDLDSDVYVEFNMPIAANNLNGVTIKNGNNESVANVKAYIDSEKLRIRHDDFEIETVYTVRIPAGAINGIREEISWTFSTETTTDVLGNLADKVNIYPNPSSGLIYIEAPENSEIKIFDVSGRVLDIHNVQDNKTFEINQTAGVYFINITNNGKTSVHKVIVN